MAGEAECQFNTNCWIRGRMVGMTGDFSGTFSAQIVDVASAVNIRNGAVSTYTQLTQTPPNPDRKQSLKVMEFAVQQQPYDAFIDITLPISILYEMYEGEFNPRIRWSRNGVVIREDSLNDMQGAMQFFNSVRLLDFDVPANTLVTYKVELIDYYSVLLRYVNGQPQSETGLGGPGTGTFVGTYVPEGNNHQMVLKHNPYFMMWFKGKALIGIRKR
uniref:Tail fiber protein n=1 Tax=Pseudomonas phage Nican01 TaxID=3138540 RepID=A0AAU6W1N9_9CAUD